jgi:beta-lactamase regulating signal transducer with metallopeptidase domain
VSVAFVSAYLVSNALIVLALLALQLVHRGSTKFKRQVPYRTQLQLGYALVVAALIAPLASFPQPGGNFMPMTSQVWSANSMRALDDAIEHHDQPIISAAGLETGVPADTLSRLLLWLCLAGALVALARAWTGNRSARLIVRRAYMIRRSGSLHILATDEATVPFSFWVPGAAYIVIPAALILRPEDFRLAVHHEGQHHRHGDGRVIYLMELLRGLFLLNPAVHLLLRRLQALQEFSCDEAIIGRSRVTPQRYCDCLLSVAEEAIRAQEIPTCLHMAAGKDGSLLSLRIRAVLREPGRQIQRWRLFALYAVSVLGILAVAIALHGSIHDRRVSLTEAQAMAGLARPDSTLPIEVNEQVLAELNRFVGTPDGRTFIRGALQRMSAYEPMISAQLRQHHLPPELLIIPLVESGYRNRPQGPDARQGAGIWMFIAPTARSFGLDTTAGKDERLDVASETRAAMRILSSLREEFGDWGLALLAYNSGEKLVRRAITEVGATDAFTAVQHGYENDRHYFARVIAALIVFKNARRLGFAG